MCYSSLFTKINTVTFMTDPTKVLLSTVVQDYVTRNETVARVSKKKKKTHKKRNGTENSVSYVCSGLHGQRSKFIFHYLFGRWFGVCMFNNAQRMYNSNLSNYTNIPKQGIYNSIESSLQMLLQLPIWTKAYLQSGFVAFPITFNVFSIVSHFSNEFIVFIT